MGINLTVVAAVAVEMILPLIIFLIVLISGLIIRKLLIDRLAQTADGKYSQRSDMVISSIKGPFVIWFSMLGIYFALKFSKLPANIVDVASKALFVLGIFSFMMVLTNVSSRLIEMGSGRSKANLFGMSLTRNISRIFIWGIGLLIVLDGLGISITPIMATLGVGGLSAALALQDTLANLFAGINIIVNRLLQIGDYIKLASGEEGYVADINWRMTKVRMLDNNIILIPNSKLTQTNLTNYCFPDKSLVVKVEVGVHYKSDLEKVERITCEVAKEVMRQTSGGVPEFEPSIRYHTFGDFSIQFTAVLRAKEFADQYLVKHEFIKRLHERYKKEGISIPYPVMTINRED